jgi:hypothetical protein
MRIAPNIYLVLILIASLVPVHAFAQEEDSQVYMSEVEGLSILFRGKIEKHYGYRYTGTYFAYQEDFVLGDIFYNKKLYKGVYINLNSHTDQLLVKQNKTSLPIRVEKFLVDWFMMDGRTFVRVKDGPEGSLEGGYYEVLVDDRYKLLKRIRKNYREDLNSSGQQSQIVRVFDQETAYYLNDGYGWIEVKGKKTFAKQFPLYKKEINSIFNGATRQDREEKDGLYKKIMEVVK